MTLDSQNVTLQSKCLIRSDLFLSVIQFHPHMVTYRALLALSFGLAKLNAPSYLPIGRLECLQDKVPLPPAAPRSLIQESSEQKLPWREIWNFWASWRIRQDGWPWWEQDDGDRTRCSGGVDDPTVATPVAHESWLTDLAPRPRPHGNHWQPTVWDWDRAAASLSLLALLVCLLLVSLSVLFDDLLENDTEALILSPDLMSFPPSGPFSVFQELDVR